MYLLDELATPMEGYLQAMMHGIHCPMKEDTVPGSKRQDLPEGTAAEPPSVFPFTPWLSVAVH